MTNPQASPDGTGTQTDEVSRALANIRGAAQALASVGYRAWNEMLGRSASVLSAEIERLTRRVASLENDVAEQSINNRHLKFLNSRLNAEKAEAALASAAAADEGLAEFKACVEYNADAGVTAMILRDTFTIWSPLTFGGILKGHAIDLGYDGETGELIDIQIWADVRTTDQNGEQR